MKSAALYLRSSKDRHDVSISAQRHELQDLARSKGMAIVREYEDLVESGKSMFRPGFQKLLQAIKDKGRDWDTLLILDTSRLSRRRFHAQAFKHEAKRHNVEIIYAKMPDLDPITSVIVESVFEAMDEVHSLMSKEKGLAGMAENVRQGWRAGGRAPYGYRLDKIETGATRDGSPVTKSRLAPSEDAPKVSAYLKARAAGMPRPAAASRAGIDKAKTTLIGIEWNALTYSGATVWNVHNEIMDGGGYKSGHKRRARGDWIMREGTHPALITRAEAGQILHQLEESASKRSIRTRHVYLLAGLLTDAAGRKWQGDSGKYYAAQIGTTKKRVPKAAIEQAVVAKVVADIRSPEMVRGILDAAKAQLKDTEPDEGKMIQKRMDRITARISKMVNMAADMDNPGAIMREIDALEAERAEVEESLVLAQQRWDNAALLSGLCEADVQAMLDTLSRNLESERDETLKTFLGEIIDRIQLDGDHLAIHYRLPARSGATVASPRVADPTPTSLAVVMSVKGWR